ncbi:MAG: glutamate racemase, partial [Clostridia bacterium]|nr:glutamate racemase [Clostridia bacterium]
MDNRPVGVFDSGLGGLTAVRELRRLLPNEDIVYFGDTGRCPYGTKGRVTIERFAAQDIRFLLGFNVKVIVIACNTVSSVALEMASEMSPVPVVGVIESAARAASAATKSGKIGVLGTFTTITSGRYEQALHALQPSLTVTGRACPMFVPLVENGYFGRDCRVAEIIAHEYLDELRGTVDTLILGCTHYPILKGMIADIMGDGVALIDTGRETAMEAARLLEHRGLL